MAVKRSHTAANVAPAIVALRDGINAAFPKRDRSSDGIWPSAAHSKASPSSDHEAGNALDIDDDLSGADGRGASVTPAMAAAISRDERCNYTIHDGVIYNDGHGRTYTGANKHSGHIHVSVLEALRNKGGAWTLTTKPKPAAKPKPRVENEPCTYTLILVQSVMKKRLLADLTTLGQHVVQLAGVEGRALFLVHHRDELGHAVKAACARHAALIVSETPARWGDTTAREVNPPSGKFIGTVREA